MKCHDEQHGNCLSVWHRNSFSNEGKENQKKKRKEKKLPVLFSLVQVAQHLVGETTRNTCILPSFWGGEVAVWSPLDTHLHTIIMIMYTYNVFNDDLSTFRIHNKLKTILSKYIHIQNRQS